MKRLALSLILTLVLVCPALAKDLTVSAAASLTGAFTECKPLYEKANPGVTVTFNFAASGPLLKQIEQGAPVDVFASADQKTMDDAAAKKLIDSASRNNFAQNALVLAVPTGLGNGVATMASLTDGSVLKIGITNPDTSPAGRYTKEILQKNGLWDTISPKFVMAETVVQLMQYLTQGEVDAGFFYATDAIKGGDKVKVVEEIPLEKPVSYPVAVLAATKYKPEAAAFVAFLTSPEGAAVLAKYGFKKP